RGASTWRGVRTKRHTYAKMDGKPWLLFDLEKDPYQMNNLIDKPEAKELQAKMEATLQEWLKKTGDKFEPIDVWWERIGGTGKTGSAKTLGKKTKNPVNGEQ
ncbi:MAG TPA: sulfatase/phosphatase domain-containing protein, partial [Armatimonadota bacterium]|nr:sulfatase/phosphatase domain-containing protein [Armatimonadota bacterium]